MSEVKRYVTTCDCMSEAPWGDYVRHADYDALAAECERLREDRDSHQRECIKALAELAALKGGQEAVAWYTDDHLTDRSATTYDKAVAARWKSKGWSVFELFAAPPAQASAWVPEGCRQVIRDLLWAGYQRPFCQDGLVERCGCWRCASKRADTVLSAAPTPGASDGKEST